MIYSLPNGKIIHLTIEEYLDLTDQDIQFLMSINAGEYSQGPWHGSPIKTRETTMEYGELDTSIDYAPEDDDKYIGETLSFDEAEGDLTDTPEEDLD